jgi:hypothetical protein
MSSTKKNTEALKEHKIIPDVLSDNVKPAYSLTLNWPNTTLESPAQELGGEETQPQPLVYLNSAVNNSSPACVPTYDLDGLS